MRLFLDHLILHFHHFFHFLLLSFCIIRALYGMKMCGSFAFLGMCAGTVWRARMCVELYFVLVYVALSVGATLRYIFEWCYNVRRPGRSND